MQIDAQVIENLFITFIIHDHDVENFKNNFAKTQILKNTFPFHLILKLKSILVN
jgi:hypothetical protein